MYIPVPYTVPNAPSRYNYLRASATGLKMIRETMTGCFYAVISDLAEDS